MRLRVHDDGRWAVLADPDDDLPWMKYPLRTAEGTTVPGVTSWLSDSEVHFDGWHEAVVLTPTSADARRLAEAWWPGIELRGPHLDETLRHCRSVLDRLAGTGPIRDAATHSMGADDVPDRREWRSDPPPVSGSGEEGGGDGA